jgi:hypothetical protein
VTEIVFQSCLPIQASSQCDPSGLTCNVSSLNLPSVNCVRSKYPIVLLLTSGILAAKVTDLEAFCESPVLVIFKTFFRAFAIQFTTIGETQRHGGDGMFWKFHREGFARGPRGPRSDHGKSGFPLATFAVIAQYLKRYHYQAGLDSARNGYNL